MKVRFLHVDEHHIFIIPVRFHYECLNLSSLINIKSESGVNPSDECESRMLVVCVQDAPGCVPGEHSQGGSGGREGPGSGPEGGEDTWSCTGCSRDRTV